MASRVLLQWIHESRNDEWVKTTTSQVWRQLAVLFEQEDPVMATLCRRIADNLEKLVERMDAHLLDEQFAQEDQAQEDIDQMIEQALKKATEQ